MRSRHLRPGDFHVWARGQSSPTPGSPSPGAWSGGQSRPSAAIPRARSWKNTVPHCPLSPGSSCCSPLGSFWGPGGCDQVNGQWRSRWPSSKSRPAGKRTSRAQRVHGRPGRGDAQKGATWERPGGQVHGAGPSLNRGQWTAELSAPASDTVAYSSLQMHGWKRWYDRRLRAFISWGVTGIRLRRGGRLGGDENGHRGC